MRSPVPSRRLVVTFILLVGLLGLAIPVSRAQTRPDAPATARAGARERLAAQIDELSKRIGERLELQRQAERADAALALQEEAASGGRALLATAPTLANNEYQIRQIEIQRDLLADQYGTQHPRYKAITYQLETMQEAYNRQLEAARSKVAAALDAARAEAATTRKKLDIATDRVEAAKIKLLDTATTGRGGEH